MAGAHGTQFNPTARGRGYRRSVPRPKAGTGPAVIESISANVDYLGNGGNITKNSGDLNIGTIKAAVFGAYIQELASVGAPGPFIGMSFGIGTGLTSESKAAGVCRGTGASEGRFGIDIDDPNGSSGDPNVRQSFDRVRYSITQWAKSDTTNDVQLTKTGTSEEASSHASMLGIGQKQIEGNPTVDKGMHAKIFEFTGLGPYQTGALAFNPVACLLIGLTPAEDDDERLVGWGWAVGTAPGEQMCYLQGNRLSGTNTEGFHHTGGGIWKHNIGGTGSTQADSLTVNTMTKAGGVVMDWNGTDPSSTGLKFFLLVIGQGDGGITGLQAEIFDLNMDGSDAEVSTGQLGAGLKCAFGVYQIFPGVSARAIGIWMATSAEGAKAAGLGMNQAENTGAAFYHGTDADSMGGQPTDTPVTSFAGGELDMTLFDTVNGEIKVTPTGSFTRAIISGIALRDAVA